MRKTEQLLDSRKNPIKYILVIDHIAKGGAEHILIDYYHHLENNGHIPYVFVLSGHDEQSAWTKGLRIVYGSDEDEDNLLKKTCQQINLFIRLKKLAERVKPDVIFSFLEKSNLLTMLLPSKAVKIVTVHSILSIQYTKIKSEKVRKILYTMIKWAYNNCPNVVAVSEQVKKDLVTSFKVMPSHIRVINNYVDKAKIGKNAKESIDNFQFKDNIHYVINIGRFSYPKAQWKLLKAFSLCIKGGLKQTHLILMGNGDYIDNLKKLAKDLKIERNTTFLPFNTNPYKYMAKADLFVLSSIREGFPIVLAEASSLRIPFIGSRKAIPEEMFDDKRVWEQVIFNSSTLAKDFTTTIHEDEVALSKLIQKGIEDSDFRNMILEHTALWEKNNDKGMQFRMYDSLALK